MKDNMEKINNSIKIFFEKIKKYVNDKTYITIVYFNDNYNITC